MTSHSVPGDSTVSPKVESNQRAQDCLLPMGITSENVAERYGVGRKQQHAASVTSYQLAAAATANGKFKQEIVPVHTKLVDPKTGEEKQVTIAVDDGIRPQATLAELATSRLSRKVAPPQQAIHPRSVMGRELCCS